MLSFPPFALRPGWTPNQTHRSWLCGKPPAQKNQERSRLNVGGKRLAEAASMHSHGMKRACAKAAVSTWCCSLDMNCAVSWLTMSGSGWKGQGLGPVTKLFQARGEEASAPSGRGSGLQCPGTRRFRVSLPSSGTLGGYSCPAAQPYTQSQTFHERFWTLIKTGTTLWTRVQEPS